MDGVLQWGIGLIEAVQKIESAPLTLVMLIITQLGSEYFYLIALPLLFWCVDERKAIRLGIVVFFSTFLNLWIKDLFAIPRPYVLKPEIGLSHEESFALPSGHAQGSLTFWGMLASWFKKPWGLVLAIALPLLIGFTRVYLGVHYPTDVFAGWGIAALILLVYYLFGPRIETVLRRLNIRLQIAIIAIFSWIFCALYLKDVSAAGGFFGIGIGYAFSRSFLRFDAKSGTWWMKTLRYLLGLALMLGLYFGMKKVFPGIGNPNAALFKFLRYAILGMWVTLGGPALFIFIKLAKARPAEPAVAKAKGPY